MSAERLPLPSRRSLRSSQQTSAARKGKGPALAGAAGARLLDATAADDTAIFGYGWGRQVIDHLSADLLLPQLPEGWASTATCKLAATLAAFMGCETGMLAESGAAARQAALAMASHGAQARRLVPGTVLHIRGFDGLHARLRVTTAQGDIRATTTVSASGTPEEWIVTIEKMVHRSPDHISALCLQPPVSRTLPTEFLMDVRNICDDLGLAWVWDESQIGLGRTGRVYCLHHAANARIRPDFLVLGDSLAAGYTPIGAIVTRYSPDRRTSTYIPQLPSPLAASIAVYTVYSLIHHGTLDAIDAWGASLSDRLREGLENTGNAVRQLGLGVVVELQGAGRRYADSPAAAVVHRASNTGLRLSATSDLSSLLLTPPFNCRADEYGLIAARTVQAIRGSSPQL
ncbi:adenosylmethionine-8-amino-7-oxononanoate aminotransferase [Nocardiopsis mwathae]|uniref:Adenosylmethionine-8-amino-7-oxononanoate aminotransferase n=1 Tax=Nocardiopsis mwathae TaxID=1472723 RepID=A0A7W9YJM1_9ACTN|nr:aminotransferase class III-fold pyridoxal phosphate-dependent enzyme [Nocardiopsis mwathae]MBB6172406.1 adenosylmethionine-8-amino-7-oxononanoate aminotransferase [Nocardiopsis mwathae]